MRRSWRTCSSASATCKPQRRAAAAAAAAAVVRLLLRLWRDQLQGRRLEWPRCRRPSSSRRSRHSRCSRRPATAATECLSPPCLQPAFLAASAQQQHMQQQQQRRHPRSANHCSRPAAHTHSRRHSRPPKSARCSQQWVNRSAVGRRHLQLRQQAQLAARCVLWGHPVSCCWPGSRAQRRTILWQQQRESWRRWLAPVQPHCRRRRPWQLGSRVPRHQIGRAHV